MPAENGAKLQITVVTEQDVNLLVTIMMHLTTQKSGEDSGRKCPCADALVITAGAKDNTGLISSAVWRV